MVFLPFLLSDKDRAGMESAHGKGGPYPFRNGHHGDQGGRSFRICDNGLRHGTGLYRTFGHLLGICPEPF